MLQAWTKTFNTKKRLSKYGVMEEPILYNSVIQGVLISSKSVQTNMLMNKCTKLRDLMNHNGWKSLEEVMELTELWSKWLASRFLEEVQTSSPVHYRHVIQKNTDCHY